MLLARPLIRLQAPNSHSLFMILATFPLLLSPVTIITSSIEGPQPNLAQNSSITMKISLCLGVNKTSSACSRVPILAEFRND